MGNTPLTDLNVSSAPLAHITARTTRLQTKRTAPLAREANLPTLQALKTATTVTEANTQNQNKLSASTAALANTTATIAISQMTMTALFARQGNMPTKLACLSAHHARTTRPRQQKAPCWRIAHARKGLPRHLITNATPARRANTKIRQDLTHAQTVELENIIPTRTQPLKHLAWDVGTGHLLTRKVTPNAHHVPKMPRRVTMQPTASVTLDSRKKTRQTCHAVRVPLGNFLTAQILRNAKTVIWVIFRSRTAQPLAPNAYKVNTI